MHLRFRGLRYGDGGLVREGVSYDDGSLDFRAALPRITSECLFSA